MNIRAHTFAYPCKEVVYREYSIDLLRDCNQNNTVNNGPYAGVHSVRRVLIDQHWKGIVMVAVAMVHWLAAAVHTSHWVAVCSMPVRWA